MDDAEKNADGGADPSSAGPGPNQDLVGHALDGRFRLDAEIGSGGMGRVYRACQLSVGRDVAVKVLHGSLSVEKELRDRFFREAQLVSNMNHPNIVQLYDFGQEPKWGLLYLAMELVDGISLEELVGRGPLQPRLALEMVYQVCGALAEAHHEGVIHRDLKAENLLLASRADGSLQVKVVDFGIAFPKETAERLTATGRIYGTPAYMAPEQARGGEVDARTDLYSLGVILFEMLSGRLPIEGDSHIQVMVKQVESGPPPLSEALERPGEVPESVIALTDEMLQTMPEDRPASAREVRSRIESIRRAEGWEPVRLPQGPMGVDLFDAGVVGGADGALAGDGGREASTRHVGGRADEPADGIDEPARAGSDGTAGSDGAAAPGNDDFGDGGFDNFGEEAAMGQGNKDKLNTDSNGSGGGKWVLVAILVGLFFLIALAVVGFVAWRWILPNVDTSNLGKIVSKQADAGREAPANVDEPDESDDEPAGAVAEEVAEEGSEEETDARETADSETTDEKERDPVCGLVRRAAFEKAAGTYRPQGGKREATLKVDSRRLHLRWESGEQKGGGTVWIARSEVERHGHLSVGCARYVGFGSGNRCRGQLKTRGPLLVVDLEGAESCEEHFSGVWVPE